MPEDSNEPVTRQELIRFIELNKDWIGGSLPRVRSMHNRLNRSPGENPHGVNQANDCLATICERMREIDKLFALALKTASRED